MTYATLTGVFFGVRKAEGETRDLIRPLFAHASPMATYDEFILITCTNSATGKTWKLPCDCVHQARTAL